MEDLCNLRELNRTLALLTMSNIVRREREKMMTPLPIDPPQRGKRRHVRLLLAACLVAAALVIGVLVVTSVLLFNGHSKGIESQPGTLPISITPSNCASLSAPVLVDLCTHHQFTDLLQSRKMGEYALVLERAYIDMNQLVITYHVFSQSTGQETLANLLSAVITTSQGQSFMPGAYAWMSGGPQVVQFSTPTVPAQTRTLQLHVEVNQFYIEPRPGTPPAPQRTVVPGPVTFDFTLEYHGGLVVTPHQTVTVKALSVTLERVRISPSETIIEGTTKGTFPRSPDYTLSLDAAGRSPGGLSTEPEFEGDSPFSAFTYEGLLGQHGTWTFEMSYGSGREGPWVFHFRVP
jgi:hypothetical protein